MNPKRGGYIHSYSLLLRKSINQGFKDDHFLNLHTRFDEHGTNKLLQDLLHQWWILFISQHLDFQQVFWIQLHHFVFALVQRGKTRRMVYFFVAWFNWDVLRRMKVSGCFKNFRSYRGPNGAPPMICFKAGQPWNLRWINSKPQVPICSVNPNRTGSSPGRGSYLILWSWIVPICFWSREKTYLASWFTMFFRHKLVKWIPLCLMIDQILLHHNDNGTKGMKFESDSCELGVAFDNFGTGIRQLLNSPERASICSDLRLLIFCLSMSIHEHPEIWSQLLTDGSHELWGCGYRLWLLLWCSAGSEGKNGEKKRLHRCRGGRRLHAWIPHR